MSPDQGKSIFGEYTWIWIATVVLFAVSAVATPGSVSMSAVRAMLPFAGMLAIVAVGQTLVIQQRGIDMSAVGAIALTGILVSKWSFEGGSLLVATAATLLAGLLIGAINGLLVTRVNISPIVTTLATNALIIGAVRQISKGAPLTSPPPLREFATRQFVGLPYSLLLAIAFVIAAAFITTYTAYGRRFVAVGVNPRAARTSGIIAERYQVGAYAMAGLCFAVTGMLLAGYIGNASAAAGNDYLLPGIAAVVVGGTPFSGGRGSVIASGIAALFMTQLGQMVLSLGATSAVQLLVQALAIVLATSIRGLPQIVRS
jgi:ribose transport system permease protein